MVVWNCKIINRSLNWMFIKMSAKLLLRQSFAKKDLLFLCTPRGSKWNRFNLYPDLEKERNWLSDYLFNWEREGGGERERGREGGIIFSYKRKNRLQLASLSLCSSLWQVFEQKIPSDCSRILYFLVSKIVRFIESEIKLLIHVLSFWSFSA